VRSNLAGHGRHVRAPAAESIARAQLGARIHAPCCCWSGWLCPPTVSDHYLAGVIAGTGRTAGSSGPLDSL